MIEEQEKFADAVSYAVTTFNTPKHKKKLSDLSPRFWVALLDLELGCKDGDWESLVATFKAAYKQLGAPGDFGYGTPCGDALRDVYDCWNDLSRAKNPKPVSA